MTNLGFPVGTGFDVGNCNGNSDPVEENCPTICYISVSGGVVTFNVTDAMNWDQSNRQLPFKLAAPFSFTAAEWANEMSANGIGLIFMIQIPIKLLGTLFSYNSTAYEYSAKRISLAIKKDID